MDFPAGISSAHVRQVFQGAADLTERRLDLHGVAATAFFLDGLTAGKDIAQVLLRPAAECLSGSAEEMYRQCLTGTIWAAVAKEVQDLPTLCSLLSPMTYAETDTLPSSPRAGSALPFVSSLQYGGFFGLTRAGVTIKICLAYLCSRN